MNQLLYDFVEQNTSHFDISHDIHHAIKVFNNSHKIIKSMKIDYEYDIITWTSMLHDVCDHKYPNSISKEELFKFIKINLGTINANRIMTIIDNISYYKEVRGERDILSYPDSLYLDVISDANRLESLGYNGIKRCESFIKYKINGITTPDIIKERIIKYCYEKLLKLYPNYFKTFIGKELAFPLHEEIIEYVKNI